MDFQTNTHTHTEKQKRDNGEFYLVILHCKFWEFDFDCKMKWNRIANRESVAKKMKCTMENCCWLGFDLIYCNLKQRQQLQHTHTHTHNNASNNNVNNNDKNNRQGRQTKLANEKFWNAARRLQLAMFSLTRRKLIWIPLCQTDDNRQRQPTTTKATTKASNESDSDNDNGNNERECECEREWKAVSDGDVDADGRDAVSFAAKNSWQH